MRIDFKNIFGELKQYNFGVQQKLNISDCVLRIYCAISSAGKSRLSILTSNPSVNIESTKVLKVVQGKESENTYWTCFELQDRVATNVFYALCDDLIEATIGIENEVDAMNCLVNRYYAWKIMFKKWTKLSEEKTKGLFGELYFLNEYMIPAYGVESAINAWSGPSYTNKDFSIKNTWYEVKTISADAQVVKISSLSQLTADSDGELCIVRVEKMSDEYNDGKSCISDLVTLISNKIETTELKSCFLSKLVEYGFDLSDESTGMKLKVQTLFRYLVNDKFPKITKTDIMFNEIGKVSYELILNMIENYKIKE
ncbi:MAG TPA: PD-(D/E)XK motif protein [Candidatus Pelethenecus sp.]|nr:PD-(D/E)XK motif protein [Candidatus Pelethenecus sp.]